MKIIRMSRSQLPMAALILALQILYSGALTAAVPEAVINGPIPLDPQGHPSLNMIYSSSAIELASRGFIEEEFFIEGSANRYSNSEMENSTIVDSGHRYKTRLIVRRPESAAQFNGVVVVEWINVTGGPDKDIDWWQSGEHFIRNGYAYVAVSAQQMGIDTMQTWSSQRYSSLDVTHDGMATRDELSYDIFYK